MIAQAEGAEVFYVTVRPRYDCDGHVRHTSRALTVEQAVLVTLAGPAAQRRYFPLLATFDADVDDYIGRSDNRARRARCCASCAGVTAPHTTRSRWI